MTHNSVRYHLLAKTNTQVFSFSLLCNNVKVKRYVVVPSTDNCIVSANVAIKTYMDKVKKYYHDYTDLKKVKTGNYEIGIWYIEPYPPASITI